MKKANFLKSDWFFGVVVSLVVLALGNGDLLQGLERKAYDLGVAATSRVPSDKVAVIAIDKRSLDNIGRWPWSREVMADLVDKLAMCQVVEVDGRGEAHPIVNLPEALDAFGLAHAEPEPEYITTRPDARPYPPTSG